MRKTFGCLIILFLSLTIAKAQHTQDDYVVIDNGDTVLCAFKHNFWSHLAYKPLNASKFTVIDPSGIVAYHLKNGNANYRALTITGINKTAFLQVMEQGSITLYQLMVPGKTRVYHWYARKNNQPLVEIKNTRNVWFGEGKFKQRFVDLISDNKAILSFYNEQHRYNLKTLQNIIHLYDTAQADKS